MTMVEIPASGMALDAYLALPGTHRAPGVIVIQEWWGLVPHIRTVCDRLAEEGFVALAPDLYRGAATTEPDEAHKLMMGLKVAQSASDLAAAADYLVRSGCLPADRVGAMGFCMGGGLALLAPTVSPHIDCAMAFYPAMTWPEYHPAWDTYRGREAVIHQCEADVSSTGPEIARYAAAIADHGGVAVVETYAGTPHAFFNDERPETFHAAASRLAWDRSLAMLHRRLDGPF
ncbi:MAG: dienelactone hydrolase family protein [Candidatus Nanopelagicales bacterium]|jgi:carboxymethylenebutenolidase|nr:dienelactone hydrolase family protein [Candidatus Nanopelagicales bacterium]MDP4715406.1 dienelactone hydrolase family protein [Candidatus Nanopelagicales bacterium]MDP4907216.1 dienelactone hydrolase family protein [Candidatus Nanopelagicales bacterium]MDP4974636.1 dienelactone hydrolase family protein [Candidatus Nanopelagicales bacterium]MDP5095888.1 dienelactone hydrolase family protein [Candidatus Nanopelagicales bacterium]